MSRIGAFINKIIENILSRQVRLQFKWLGYVDWKKAPP